MSTSFSKMLKKVWIRKMGLQLPISVVGPLFWVNFAIFSLDGKTSCEKDLFINSVKGANVCDLQVFVNLADIKPTEIFIFMQSMTLQTSSCVVRLSGKL